MSPSVLFSAILKQLLQSVQLACSLAPAEVAALDLWLGFKWVLNGMSNSTSVYGTPGLRNKDA